MNIRAAVMCWTESLFIFTACHHPTDLSLLHSFFCVYFSLSLSASTMMMLIKWTEWIIQIPMAAFLPSVWSAAPLCLLEGIIHLALSLYTTPSRSMHTHTMHTQTHTYCQPTYLVCLHGWKAKVIKWMDCFMGTVDWCMLHCCARKVLNSFCLTVTLLLHLLCNRLEVFESKSDIGAPSMMKSFHARLSGKPFSA